MELETLLVNLDTGAAPQDIFEFVDGTFGVVPQVTSFDVTEPFANKGNSLAALEITAADIYDDETGVYWPILNFHCLVTAPRHINNSFEQLTTDPANFVVMGLNQIIYLNQSFSTGGIQISDVSVITRGAIIAPAVLPAFQNVRFTLSLYFEKE